MKSQSKLSFHVAHVCVCVCVRACVRACVSLGSSCSSIAYLWCQLCVHGPGDMDQVRLWLAFLKKEKKCYQVFLIFFSFSVGGSSFIYLNKD